jgi:hypothetical protein
MNYLLSKLLEQGLISNVEETEQMKKIIERCDKEVHPRGEDADDRGGQQRPEQADPAEASQLYPTVVICIALFFIMAVIVHLRIVEMIIGIC